MENFKLIKTEWTDNKEKNFNEENKFTNNLQEAYSEWFNNLEIKGYNFRKIVKVALNKILNLKFKAIWMGWLEWCLRPFKFGEWNFYFI